MSRIGHADQDAEEADGDVAEDCHDLRRLAGMNPAGILAKVDIAYPMQAVLDRPVSPQKGRQALGIRPGWRQAGNSEAHRDPVAASALVDPVALDPEDLLQTGPTAILGSQGAGGLQRAHFDAAAVQVSAASGRNRLGHHRWLAEQGGDVVTQGGLVVFHGQDVVATLGHDLVHDRFLGQLGIPGDDPTREVESLQERQGRADLVTVVHGPLRQDHSHLGGEGRQELLGRLAATAAAALGLAVQRQRPQRRQPGPPPLAQRLLQSGHIDLAENPTQRGRAGPRKVRQA